MVCSAASSMAGALATASGGRVRGAGLGFGGSPPERLKGGALVLPGHEVDAPPAADLLAQLAPHTGLLVHLDLAEVGREVLARRADAVERADVDARAAAVAVVGMHAARQAQATGPRVSPRPGGCARHQRALEGADAGRVDPTIALAVARLGPHIDDAGAGGMGPHADHDVVLEAEDGARGHGLQLARLRVATR